MATLELVYYTQCVELVKDPKIDTDTPRDFKMAAHYGKKSLGPGGVPIKSIYVLQVVDTLFTEGVSPTKELGESGIGEPPEVRGDKGQVYRGPPPMNPQTVVCGN